MGIIWNRFSILDTDRGYLKTDSPCLHDACGLFGNFCLHHGNRLITHLL